MSYIYIAPHIVGTPADYGYCYYSDRVEHKTRGEAQRYGERMLDHDDFWVAEIRDGRVVALYSKDRRRNDPSKVDDINREWGI